MMSFSDVFPISLHRVQELFTRYFKDLHISRPSTLCLALGLSPQLWPPICIYQPLLPICIYRPWRVRSLGLHIPTLSRQFVFTGPGLRLALLCSEFAFIFIFVVGAVDVVILAIAVISLD